VHFARIEVQVEAAGGRQNSADLNQPRLEEVEIVVVDIDVTGRAKLDGPISPPAEPGSVAALLSRTVRKPPQRLPLAGVERRSM